MQAVTLVSTNKLMGLEALRGFAALYVFIHHAHLFPNQGFGRLLYFGQEAVIIFFLLSGFVIYYSSNREHLHWKTYLMHRIRRIYPIFIIALILAYCSQSLISGHWLSLEVFQLIGNVLMLQDVSALKRGVWFDPYYGNSPLWSLSYEWWFYMLFIPLGLNKKFVEYDKSVFMALGISIVGFIGYQYIPNQLCLFAGYFFIWWAGVELGKEYLRSGRVSFCGQKSMLFGLALMSSLWLLPVVIQIIQHKHLQFGVDPVLQFRHNVAALLFAMAIIFLSSRRTALYAWAMKPFISLAPISYAIYVIHEPLLNIVYKFTSPYPQWFSALITFPLLLMLAWLLEKYMQPFVKRVFSRSTRHGKCAASCNATP